MKEAWKKTWQNIKMAIPITIGILMLVSILNLILKDSYSKIFTNNYFLDPVIGAIAGSVTFGIPISSYVIGGELLKEGVSLLAVSAFIFAWTTVGVVLIPLEMKFFGKKFAILRNSLNFIASIVIAILTVTALKIFT